jgi:hypothetical protein
MKQPQTWMDSLDKRPKRRNMDMRFGTWNVRSLYRASICVSMNLRGATKREITSEDENGDLAYSHNILNRWKNYLSHLLNARNVSDVRQIVVHRLNH